jgi:LacI family transcriptional regulator
MVRQNIALIVETSLASGREILRGIARYARENDGWHLVHGARGLQDATPDWLSEWNGDGVIARVQTKEMATALRRLPMPVVDVLGVVEGSEFPLVHVDDERVASAAAQHFRERDFQNFAFFGIAGENWSDRRREGFTRACGRPVAVFERSRNEMAAGNIEGELRRWLRDSQKPVGVLVASDQLGLLLLESCRAEDIAVPEEVAVIGVDNDVPLCEISSPPLTSIRAGHFRVGFEAACLLDGLMAGEIPPSQPLLVAPTGLVMRGSSDTEAIEDSLVVAAVRHLRENLAKPVTNESLAKAVGISRTLLQTRFRAAMGRSIREYLVDLRLRRARLLIETSDLTLADIAIRSGFRHQEYLGDVFKRRFGVTPGKLRKQ